MASELETSKEVESTPRTSDDLSKPTELKEAHRPRLSVESGVHNGSETPPSINPGTKEDFAADFKPSIGLYVAFLTLAVITLMVALDGTSISVALPVSSENRCAEI